MQIEFHKVTSKRDYKHRFLCVYFFRARPPLTTAGLERIPRKPLHRLLERSQHLSSGAQSFPSPNYPSFAAIPIGSSTVLGRTNHIMKVIDAVPTAPPKKTLVIMKSRFITKVFTLFLVVRSDAIITKYVNILAEHLNTRGEIQTEVVI